MKNLKKLVSGILSAAMLLSTAVTGFAAAKGDCTTEEWAISNYGTLPAGFTLGEKVYVEPSSDDGYNGSNFSMHFYHEDTTTAGSYQVRIYDSVAVAAGTYTLSFYTKGTITNAWTTVGIEAAGGNALLNNAAWTITSAEDGWTKYEAQFTTTAAANKVLFRTGGGADFYLDNFEVCPVTNGVKGANILANGDFERTTKKITTKPKEDYIAEVWQEQYVGIPTGYTAEKDVFAEPSTAESFEGEYSMHMVHPDTTAKGYVRIFDRQSFAIGTYNVSFYLKGTVTEGWTAFGLDAAIGIGSFTKSDAGNGWTKYEKEITTASVSDRAYFRVYGGGDFYLDNFEVCPVTNGVKGSNMLLNGGFENTRKAAAGLINPMVYPSVDGVSAVLTWRNPNYGVVDSVTATLNGGGFEDSELDLGTLILTTGGNTGTTRTNTCLIQGLANNTDYVLTLNTKMTQNSITTTYTADIPFRTTTDAAYSTIDGKSAGKWILAKQQTDSAYMNTIPAIDTDIKYSGNSSLRLDSNMFSRVSNIYAGVAQKVTLQRNKRYILTFKAKSAGVNQFKAMVNAKSLEEIDGEVRSWSKQDYLEQNTTAYIFKDWTEYEYDLSIDGENPLFSESVTTADEINTTITIFPEQMCGSMWIDDVAVYEIDSDDEICSGNLLKDGGMEFVSSEITTKFEDTNKKVLEAIQTGDINVTTGVRNISLGDNFTTATIIALYNGSTLCDVWMSEGKVAEVADGIPTSTWTQKVTVPNDGGKYSIKVMYWNSSDGMTPIKALEELK